MGGDGCQEGALRQAPVLQDVPAGPRLLRREDGGGRCLADRRLRRRGDALRKGVPRLQALAGVSKGEVSLTATAPFGAMVAWPCCVRRRHSLVYGSTYSVHVLCSLVDSSCVLCEHTGGCRLLRSRHESRS